MESSAATAVLVTASETIRDHVLAVAAAAGVGVRVCRAVGDDGPAPPMRTLLVGADQAAALARSPVNHRADRHLVGTAADRDGMCGWSAALGASVIVLPDGNRWLTAALVENRMSTGCGTVLALVGGSGGLGTSTLAAGLGWTASRQSLKTAIVDLDGRGGGLDVLLGLEDAPGWRWPGLTAADGYLGDLHEHLPRRESLAVVSHVGPATGKGRAGADDHAELSETAALAVVRALARDHDLVILDGGSRPGPVEREVLRMASGVLLVCASEIHGLTAATRQLGVLDPHLPVAAVLSRVRPGGHGAEGIRRALGLPVVATLPSDRALATAVGRGEPPGPGAGRKWRRCCAGLLAGVVQRSSDESR